MPRYPRRILSLLPAAVLTLQSFPAVAQIINQQTLEAANQNTQTQEEGTIPGLYYDPSGVVAPTFANSPASQTAGSIRLPAGSQTPSYFNGAWPANASSDQVLKIGHLKDHPQFKQFTELNINEVLKASGKDPATVTLSEVPIASTMTVGEYLQINPGAAEQSLEEAPAVVQSAFGYYEDEPLLHEPIDQTDITFIEQKASNPEISDIPAEDLLEGDWGDVFTEEEQSKLAKTLSKVNNRLRKLPLKQLIPLTQGIINGDWDTVKKQAKDLAIKEGSKVLIKELMKNPKIAKAIKDLPLGTLPLDKLGLADAPGMGETAIKDIPGSEDKTLNQVPGLKDVPLDQIDLALALSFTRFDLLGRIDTTDAAAVVDNIDYVISGGTKDQIPKPAPCKIDGNDTKNCRHFELDNVDGGGEPTKLSGQAWIQGPDQMVPGGQGWLRIIANGKEVTGIKPWVAGNVKLYLEDMREGSGDEVGSARLSTAWQFGYSDPITGSHYTPHFIRIPTPWRIKEGGIMLLLARSGGIPDAIRNLQPSQQQFCREPTLVASAQTNNATDSNQTTGGADGSSPPNSEQHHINQYLARIAYGESTGGTDIGPHPDTGAYGEYQFIEKSRNTLYTRTGIDAWSESKEERDRAALAWIDIYGQEVGHDIISYIRSGNFEAADYLLGRNQFTSLPGGAEDVKWNDPVALEVYGPNGNAPVAPTGATASSGVPFCQPTNGSATFAQGPAPEAGEINNAIFEAAKQMQGFDTSGGPEGGTQACAWSVDHVLAKAGIQPMRSDWVPTWSDKFRAGRGSQVKPSEAQPGDIIISKAQAHIGICMTNGCTQVLSNSSSRGSFNWVSNGQFDGFYNSHPYLHTAPNEEIWRVRK